MRNSVTQPNKCVEGGSCNFSPVERFGKKRIGRKSCGTSWLSMHAPAGMPSSRGGFNNPETTGRVSKPAESGDSQRESPDSVGIVQPDGTAVASNALGSHESLEKTSEDESTRPSTIASSSLHTKQKEVAGAASVGTSPSSVFEQKSRSNSAAKPIPKSSANLLTSVHREERPRVECCDGNNGGNAIALNDTQDEGSDFGASHRKLTSNKDRRRHKAQQRTNTQARQRTKGPPSKADQLQVIRTVQLLNILLKQQKRHAFEHARTGGAKINPTKLAVSYEDLLAKVSERRSSRVSGQAGIVCSCLTLMPATVLSRQPDTIRQLTPQTEAAPMYTTLHQASTFSATAKAGSWKET